MMRQAGISVWMLTGDKQETAINIGFSCNLIDQTQELFSLDTDSLESTKERLNVRFLLYGYHLGLLLSKGVLVQLMALFSSKFYGQKYDIRRHNLLLC